MAIELLKDWGKLTVEDTDTKKTYGQELVNNTYTGITGSFTADGVTIGPNSDSGAVRLGIYSGSNGVYAFASTEQVAPTVKSGSWNLVASALAIPSVSVAGGTALDSTLSTLNLTLASGSGLPVLTIGDNNSIATVTGSAGDDSIILSGALLKGATLDFSQSGKDKVYFANSTKQTIASALASSGNLSFIASPDGKTENAGIVLGGNLGNVTVAAGAAGDTLGVTMEDDTSAKLVSSSGTVQVSGGTITSFELESLSSGKFTLAGTSLAKEVKVGTISGGSGVFTLAKGDDTDVNLTQGTAKATFNLVSGGNVSVASSTAEEIVVSSLTGGKFTISKAGVKNNWKNATITANVDGGNLIIGGGANVLTLASGTRLSNAIYNSTSIQSTTAQTIIGAGVEGELALESAGGDVISLGSVGANAAVSVISGTADTISIDAIASGGHVALHDALGAGTNAVVFSSGSSLNGVIAASGTNGESVKAGTSAINMVGSVSRNAQVVGSDLADSFEIGDVGVGLTLTGGSGDDVYKFADGLTGAATITDFGWSNAAESASDTSKGQDILVVKNLDATTLANIKLVGNDVQLGSSKVVATVESGTTAAFVKIGTTAQNGEVYRVTDGGAKAVGSDGAQDITPTTVTGGKVFDASTKEHAYIDAGSGASTVQNFTTYTGTNERTASILNPEPMALSNVKASTAANGDVTLTDGTNTILMESLGANQMIKMGEKNDYEAVVLAGTGTDTVTDAVADAATYYIGDTLGTSALDFSNTDKTVIDLSGKNDDDKATYQNIKKIKGSDDGKSLLVSGSDAVTLEAAGAGDTLSGAGKKDDVLISNTGATTNFLLQSGVGEDTIESFVFGTGATADNVIIASDVSYGWDILNASSGELVIGQSGSTYAIEGTPADGAVVKYEYHTGVTTEDGAESIHSGAILADVSAAGGEIDFVSDANLILGQGTKTTLAVGEGETAEPEEGRENEASGINWNSKYLTKNVGVIDGTASSMTAMNGQGGYADVVKSSTVVGASTLVSLCGGLEYNADIDFFDSAADTLVASGKGNNEIYVGKTMGNDIIQNVSSGDKITFLNTKISEFADDINDIVKVSGTGFTATLGSTKITGTMNADASKVTNLVFHFDSDGTGAANDYRWDGQSLVAVTTTA